jgi:hypothetical protein
METIVFGLMATTAAMVHGTMIASACLDGRSHLAGVNWWKPECGVAYFYDPMGDIWTEDSMLMDIVLSTGIIMH